MPFGGANLNSKPISSPFGRFGRIRLHRGGSSLATRQATDAGIYVVAAAGNDGLDDDEGCPSPGSVDLAISVGATRVEGAVWANSSSGSLTDRTGDARAHPNMKPEVVAPGERIISTGEGNLWYSAAVLLTPQCLSPVRWR